MHPLQGTIVVRLLLALWLAITPTFVWAGSMTLLGAGGPAAGGGGYVGPANIAGYTSPYACWSLRACTTAIAAAGTQNLIDITDQSGSNPLTVHVLTSGDLDTATISTWVTAHSVTTIRVVTVYDQSGNGRNMTFQAGAGPPTLVLASMGTKASLLFTAASQQQLSAAAASPTTAQPLTLSTIAKPIFTSGGRLFSDGDSSFQLVNDASADSLIFAGSAAPTLGIYADSTWGSMQVVFNGASSSMNASNSGFNTPATPSTYGSSPGTNGFVNTNKLTLGSRADTSSDLPYNGNLFEFLITTTAISSANQSSMVANQRAYGSF